MNDEKQYDFLEELVPHDMKGYKKIAKKYPALDKSAQKRIVKLCEEKLAMKNDEKNYFEDDTIDDDVEVIKSIPWYRSGVFTIAASFVLVAGIGIGIAAVMGKPANIDNPMSNSRVPVPAATTSTTFSVMTSSGNMTGQKSTETKTETVTETAISNEPDISTEPIKATETAPEPVPETIPITEPPKTEVDYGTVSNPITTAPVTEEPTTEYTDAAQFQEAFYKQSVNECKNVLNGIRTGITLNQGEETERMIIQQTVSLIYWARGTTLYGERLISVWDEYTTDWEKGDYQSFTFLYNLVYDEYQKIINGDTTKLEYYGYGSDVYDGLTGPLENIETLKELVGDNII